MNFEFFAYWNGAQTRDLLEAIVNIVGSGDFLGLLQSIALVGFLSVITMAALRYKGLEVISFFMAVLLFYTLTLVPKATVIVRDDRVSAVYPVEHVPLGLAFLASSTSHIGHWLTERFETAFTSTEAERFSHFGMVFPQRALTALLAAGPVTSEGRMLIANFNRHCVIPELIEYPEKIQVLTSSGNLWKTLSSNGWVNAARRTDTPDGQWITCDQAVNIIENYLYQKEIPAIEQSLAMKLVSDHHDPSAVVAAVLPQAQTILLGLSEALSDSIKHSIFINTLDDDLSEVAALSKNPLAVATKLAKAQGNLASEINYRTMSQIAQEALPKVRNALQFVILAAFPLILLIVIASGHHAGRVIRNYLTLLIWVELWAPISSVINYLMITVDAHPMNQMIVQYGANTLMAASLIRELGASSQAIAGYLMILAPIIAFAIAKGSDIASTQMVASIMAPAQSAAQSQGSTLAQGNLSLGNSTWGNVSTNTVHSNKFDRASSLIDSSMIKTTSAYGSVTRTIEGTVTGMSATEIATGVESTMGLNTQHAALSQSQNSNSFNYTQAVNGLRQMTTQTADKTVSSFANQLNHEVSRSLGYSENTQDSLTLHQQLSTSRTESLSGSLSNAEQASYQSEIVGGGFYKPDSFGKNTSEQMKVEPSATSLMAQAKQSASGDYQLKTGLQASMTLTNAQALLDAVTHQSSSQDRQVRDQAYQTLLAATRQVAHSARESAVRQAAKTFESQLTSAYQYAQSDAFHQTATLSATQQRSDISQQELRTLMNNHPESLMTAIDMFGSAEKAQAILFHNPQARSVLAARLQAEQLAQPHFRATQPLTLNEVDQRAISQKAPFDNQLQEQFQTYQSVHENEAITQQQSTLEQTTKSKGDDSQIDSHHQKETQRIQSALKTHEAQLLQYRGNVRSSTLLYREKQSGLPTLMNNALLGGAFYQSPQEYERKLHEQSQNSSAQRLALESIGSQKDDLSIEDFEKTFQSNLHSRGISDDADSGLANNRVHSSDETQTTQSDKVKVHR